MAITRQNIARLFLPMIAVAAYFAPGIPAHSRSALAMAVWAMLMLVSAGERQPIGPRPAQPIWDERDIGQKFSIVMFHVLVLGFAVFFSVEAVRQAQGAIWSYAAVALVGTLALRLVWRNWSNRNAR